MFKRKASSGFIIIDADIEKLRNRLKTNLILDKADQYSVNRNYRKFKGFINYYFNTLNFDAFDKLLKRINDIQTLLECNEKRIRNTPKSSIQRLVEQLKMMSIINSFIDDMSSDDYLFSSKKEDFVYNLNYYDMSFKAYNVYKPRFLNNLGHRILKLIQELDKKTEGSKSYSNKRKKVLRYQEVYFDVYFHIFKDDDHDNIMNRIKEIDSNILINGEDYSLYPVY